MHISAQKYHSLCFLTHRLCLNKNKPTGGFALPTHWGKAIGKCWRKLLWTEDLRRHSLRLFLRSMAVLGVQRWVWHPFLRKRWSNALSRRNERLPSTIRRECLCWPRASWPTMSSEPRWARYTWRNLMLKITRSSRLGVFCRRGSRRVRWICRGSGVWRSWRAARPSSPARTNIPSRSEWKLSVKSTVKTVSTSEECVMRTCVLKL